VEWSVWLTVKYDRIVSRFGLKIERARFAEVGPYFYFIRGQKLDYHQYLAMFGAGRINADDIEFDGVFCEIDGIGEPAEAA